MEWKIEQNKLIKLDNDSDSDLRLEAAAIEYEREKNALKGEEDTLPQVDWPATGKDNLVLYYDDEDKTFNQEDILKLEEIIKANKYEPPKKYKDFCKKSLERLKLKDLILGAGVNEIRVKGLKTKTSAFFSIINNIDSKYKCKPSLFSQKKRLGLLPILIAIILFWIYYKIKIGS